MIQQVGLNPVSLGLAELLVDRFPWIGGLIEVYRPVNDLDCESEDGSVYIDAPIKSESGLDRLTIHHRGNFFEIGCYYNGAKFPEEFIFMMEGCGDAPRRAVDFIERVFQLPADALVDGASIRNNKQIRPSLSRSRG